MPASSRPARGTRRSPTPNRTHHPGPNPSPNPSAREQALFAQTLRGGGRGELTRKNLLPMYRTKGKGGRRLLAGVLPVALFASGHTFFVTRMAHVMQRSPFMVPHDPNPIDNRTPTPTPTPTRTPTRTLTRCTLPSSTEGPRASATGCARV